LYIISNGDINVFDIRGQGIGYINGQDKTWVLNGKFSCVDPDKAGSFLPINITDGTLTLKCNTEMQKVNNAAYNDEGIIFKLNKNAKLIIETPNGTTEYTDTGFLDFVPVKN